MKILLWLGIVSVLIVVLVLSLPFLIDLNKYQDQYKPLIEEALNRKISVQDIRLTVWPRLGARVTGFTVLDDPAFSAAPFISLTALDVGVKLMPLLSGKVEVEEIAFRDPVITVIKNKNGVLNVATIGRPGVAAPQTPSRAPVPSTEGPLKILALLAVDRVSLTGGKLTYRDMSAATPAEYILDDLELLLQSVRLGQIPSLHLATRVQPFDLPVTLNGTFGPLKETTDIEAIDLQLALGKTALTIAGSMAGHDAKIRINSPVINTAHVPIMLPLKKPVELKNLQIAAAVTGQEAQLDEFSFHLFDGQVKAQGTITAGSAAPPFSAKATIQGVQLGPVLEALGPSQLSISGTAGASATLTGQGFSMPDLTRALEGTGHLGVKDGKIEGVSVLKEVATALKVAGIAIEQPNATVFSTMETDFAIKQGIIQVQRLLMDSHDFQATGGGTIGFDQALNLAVNLSLSQEVSQRIAASSPVAKLALQDGRLVLPLAITGTTQAPAYGVDLKSLTGNVQKQLQETVKGTVKGLLEGTTKPQDVKQQGQELMKGLFGR